MKIAIGSDHAGFDLKSRLLAWLKENKFEFKDFGTFSDVSVDYPDYAHMVAKAVEAGEYERGILICGTGLGVSITANKHQSIRAALCWQEEIARLSRTHNDANIICFPGRFIESEAAVKMLKIFFETDFEGGRHGRRVNKIPCC
jgi:ribose 5-phosphate isomerase B